MKKTARHSVLSILICPECSGKFPIQRNIHRRTRERGHIKTIWCPYCKDMRDFLEIRNADADKLRTLAEVEEQQTKLVV